MGISTSLEMLRLHVCRTVNCDAKFLTRKAESYERPPNLPFAPAASAMPVKRGRGLGGVLLAGSAPRRERCADRGGAGPEGG